MKPSDEIKSQLLEIRSWLFVYILHKLNNLRLLQTK